MTAAHPCAYDLKAQSMLYYQEEGSASTKVKKKAKVASTFPEEALPDLVR